MRINPVPDFYLVIPDMHVNARHIPIYKVMSKRTGEIVKQVPTEEVIARMERIARLRNRRFRRVG